MTPEIYQLSVAILIAAFFGVAARILRQPIILAYLAAGVVSGFLSFEAGEGMFHIFSQLGVMFLLFLVGLEIDYASLRLVGRASVIVGVMQILICAGVASLLAGMLGFSRTEALYIGIAFSFSSTIIAVKMLADKRDLQSLHGKLSVGVLLVQDMIAILILIMLGGGSGGFSPMAIMLTVGKGAALFALMIFLGDRVFPYLFHRAARSAELLFLVSIAWVLVLAATVSRIGFSVEIAGFLAGLALANSAESFEIAGKIRPLRDFFIVIFFIVLGASLPLSELRVSIVPVLIFSAFVLAVKPFITYSLLSAAGYRRRTGFLASAALAQVSEFSFILIALALRLHHVGQNTASVITGAGVVSIIFSTYGFSHANWLFRRMEFALKFFERKILHPQDLPHEGGGKPIVLIGAHRLGENIASAIPFEDLLVIDFDPDVIHRMAKRGFATLYGDISDPEIYDRADFRRSKLVISTSPDFEDNIWLLRHLHSRFPKIKIIVRAETGQEQEILYLEGADYVLLPYLASGYYLGRHIADGNGYRFLRKLRDRDRAISRPSPRFS